MRAELLSVAATLGLMIEKSYASSYITAKVIKSDAGFNLLRPTDDGYNTVPAVAWGSYNNTVNITGWGLLDIHGNASYSDSDMASAAGYLEGALMAAVPAEDGSTLNVIWDHVQVGDKKRRASWLYKVIDGILPCVVRGGPNLEHLILYYRAEYGRRF